jgi:hypothetical protein
MFYLYEIGRFDENDGHTSNIKETEPEAKEQNGEYL